MSHKEDKVNLSKARKVIAKLYQYSGREDTPIQVSRMSKQQQNEYFNITYVNMYQRMFPFTALNILGDKNYLTVYDKNLYSSKIH